MASKFEHLFTVDDGALGELAQRAFLADRLDRSDRLAITIFWIVVVGLVGSRVAYFDPIYGGAMNYAANLAHIVGSLFG